MLNNIIRSFRLIKFNWKTLIVFEMIYRLFGLAVIYPIAYRLFYYSVKLTGKEYIANSEFYEYITSPSTILLGLLLFIIFGLYVAYEVVVLSILFRNNNYNNKITIQPLLAQSITKFRRAIIKFNFIIILSSLVFFFLVELLHLVGIASTISLPNAIIDEMKEHMAFYPTLYIFVLILILLFVESMFVEIQCSTESVSIKGVFTHSRTLLKKSRFAIIIEFLILNSIINIVFYTLYVIIILLLAISIYLFQEGSFVYPYILTSLYSTFTVIGFLATIVLIPVNFAWINVRYYKNKPYESLKVEDRPTPFVQLMHSNNKLFYRILSVMSIVFVVIGVFAISSVNSNQSQFQLFNTPYVIAHRGGGFYGPENTLIAIEKGIELGSDAIEIDVRFTKDGIPVVIHDATLGRTTDDTSDQFVKDLTLEELQQYDAGSWFGEEFANQTIPTLYDVLSLISKKSNVLIELKEVYPDTSEVILAIIKEVNFKGEIMIISFDEAFLRDIKSKNENVITLQLLSSFIGDIDILGDKDYIDNYGFKYDAFSDNVEYIQSLQESGKGVYVWTINDETAIIEMNNLGVDGIITDLPLYTREVIYGNKTKSLFVKLLETLFAI